MEKISKKKYLALTTILCLGIIVNFINAGSQTTGLIFGSLYLLFYSFIAGSIFITKKGWQIAFGFLILLSIISIFSAGAIYLYQFNDYLFILSVLLIPVLLAVPYYQIEIKEKFQLKKILLEYFDSMLDRRETKINLFLIFTYLTLATICFSLLWAGQTTESIQSPWQTVNRHFIAIYFLTTACLFSYILNARRTKLPLALIVLHAFLSTAVALIVYKIGYGFDPFIHRATEKIISQTGTITPKPLYYLGQYGIVIFLSKLTWLNINIIDKMLVPILSALFLPLTTFFVFSHWIKKNYALVLSLAILIIPFPYFIMTAPQNLANLFFVVVILLSLLYFRDEIKISMLWLIGLATLLTHPLAGIPLLISIFLFGLFKLLYDSYRRQLSLFFLASSVFIFALPLAFIINGSAINFNFPSLTAVNFKIIQILNNFDLPLNLTYFIWLNQAWLGLIVVALGIIYLIKNKLLKNNAAYLAAGLVIFTNYLIVKYLLTFPELTESDQLGFISRISTLAFYVLLPIFLIAVHQIIKFFWQKDNWTKTLIILSLSGLVSISFYLSYPRFNNYEPAKFFSLSAADIDAVRFIEQSADDNHIVLANQMLGVAAIDQYGFKKYYNNQFYYSMPMGNPRTLSDLYLEMVYQGAQRKTMQSAMDIAGVNESYFILNKYWKNFEKIVKQATESADTVYSIDNGAIYVFKYLKQ